MRLPTIVVNIGSHSTPAGRHIVDGVLRAKKGHLGDLLVLLGVPAGDEVAVVTTCSLSEVIFVGVAAVLDDDVKAYDSVVCVACVLGDEPNVSAPS